MSLDAEIYGWLRDHGPAKNSSIRGAMQSAKVAGPSGDVARIVDVDRSLQRLRKEGHVRFHSQKGWFVPFNKPKPPDLQEDLRRSLAALHGILERVAVEHTDVLRSAEHEELFRAAALLNKLEVKP